MPIYFDSQKQLFKTDPPNIYDIQMAVTTYKNQRVKNRDLIKR